MLKRRYEEFALYNRWANRRLYDAAERLSDADYRADHGAFFGSVHRTLNHLVVTDDIWMRRFRGEPPSPYKLDSVPHEAFADLRLARESMDDAVEAFVSRQDDVSLMQPFTYSPVTTPVRVTQPLAPALDHFFNHQTHHRGQVHALLTRITGLAPSLDLISLQREAGLGVTVEPL